jgi:hypothetical protein
MSDVDNGADEPLNGDRDGEDIDPAEYRRMLNRALREGDRRLRAGKLGDTSLSRYMSEAVSYLENERRREEAARPNPAANIAESDDFLAALRAMHDDGRMTTNRMAEVVKGYVLLCSEHLEEARAFERELTATE